MKYIVLLVILFSGCNALIDADLESKATGHELYQIDIKSITVLTDISLYIKACIQYREDATDAWANPQETIERGYGDCDDMAILFMNIAYFEFGIKCDFVAVNSANVTKRDYPYSQTIVSGGSVNHALVYYDGNYYDPLCGLVNCEKVGYTYSFDEVFNG